MICKETFLNLKCGDLFKITDDSGFTTSFGIVKSIDAREIKRDRYIIHCYFLFNPYGALFTNASLLVGKHETIVKPSMTEYFTLVTTLNKIGIVFNRKMFIRILKANERRNKKP